VNFQNALGFSAAHSRPDTKIDHTSMRFALNSCLRGVNAIRRELLAVRAQVRSRKPDLLSEIVAARHGPKDGVFTTEHLRSSSEVAFFDRLPDCRAANDRTVYFHGWNSNNLKIEFRPEFF